MILPLFLLRPNSEVRASFSVILTPEEEIDWELADMIFKGTEFSFRRGDPLGFIHLRVGGTPVGVPISSQLVLAGLDDMPENIIMKYMVKILI